MIHVFATLVSLIVAFGGAVVILASIEERRQAILSALRMEGASVAAPVSRPAPRVRWTAVRARSAPPQVARLAA